MVNEGEGYAASEEKTHIIMEKGISNTEECLPDLEKKEKESKYVIKNIQWITGNNFTVERGLQQIEDLISEEELEDRKRYHYRVCWSIPTRRKPIPRATASVYFVIEISKTQPITSPVEVFFTLESSRLIQRPEQLQFREKWLKDIIENKIIVMERFAFQ